MEEWSHTEKAILNRKVLRRWAGTERVVNDSFS